jgi:hypothetical protein
LKTCQSKKHLFPLLRVIKVKGIEKMELEKAGKNCEAILIKPPWNLKKK